MHLKFPRFAAAAGLSAALLVPQLSTAASINTSVVKGMVVAPLATSWSPTATLGLASGGVQLNNATPLGLVPASAPLHLVIGLKMRNGSGLTQLVMRQHMHRDPLFHKYLNPAQFVANFGPTGAQVTKVANYLVSQGFTNISVEPNNLVLSADATAGQASNAFNTQIGAFMQSGRVIFANITTAQVPVALSDTVLAVLGLNNAFRYVMPHAIAGASTQPQIGPHVPGTCVPLVTCPLTPRDYWKAYDAGTTPTGKNTAIAIFTAGGGMDQVIADLRFAEMKNNLPRVPVTLVRVGLQNVPPLAGAASEWDLDTQMSTGIGSGPICQPRQNSLLCGGPPLYIYNTTTLDDPSISLMYHRWVSQDIVKAGSSSFGECEAFAYLDGALQVDDEAFLEAAAQGQTMYASTGDQGSACPASGATNGVTLSGLPATVLYPASSQWVVAVGGTTLISDGVTHAYTGEAGWNAGGGGVSAFESAGFWQVCPDPSDTAHPCPAAPIAGVGTPIVPSAINAFRGMPDVAMDADIATGGLVYMASSQCTPPGSTCEFITGGTSLSSPLALGVWSRLDTAHHTEFGFAPPEFYYEYQYDTRTVGDPNAGPPPTQRIAGFHDILTGPNGLCHPVPRWDCVTGLGSLDITWQNHYVDLSNIVDGR